jgi:endoglucanase
MERRMIARRTMAAGLPLLLALPAARRPACAAAPAAETFGRGINLSSWFSGSPNQPPLTESDFRQIRAAGFDHVRIPARPESFGYDPSAEGGQLTLSLPVVEAAIALAVANGLCVDVNLQLLRDHKQLVEQDSRAADRYVALTAAVARRLAGYPADRVAFEPINEFGFYKDAAKFAALQGRVHRAVRAELPRSTIILGGPMGSGLKGLGAVVPVDDGNVIYAFHFYEPFMITHQGVSWGFAGQMIHWFRNVPYPSSLVQPGVDYAPDAPDHGKAAAELAAYVDARWDAAKIAGRIQIAADWARKNRARVVCNEFGVLRLHIEPESRYRWIRDARTALEANGIGWSLWDYADIFGITDTVGPAMTQTATSERPPAASDQARRVFQPAALQALFS